MPTILNYAGIEDIPIMLKGFDVTEFLDVAGKLERSIR